jgi:hypothetical protein
VGCSADGRANFRPSATLHNSVNKLQSAAQPREQKITCSASNKRHTKHRIKHHSCSSSQLSPRHTHNHRPSTASKLHIRYPKLILQRKSNYRSPCPSRVPLRSLPLPIRAQNDLLNGAPSRPRPRKLPPSPTSSKTPTAKSSSLPGPRRAPSHRRQRLLPMFKVHLRVQVPASSMSTKLVGGGNMNGCA